jgi:LIM-domain binding protein
MVYCANNYQMVSTGTLQVQFDTNSKLDLFEFNCREHEEFIPRLRVKELITPPTPSPEIKNQSPRMNKKEQAKRQAQQKAAPPIAMPESPVDNFGLTHDTQRFLEMAETMAEIRDLFEFSKSHPHLSPNDALVAIVRQNTENPQVQAALMANGPSGSRTPSGTMVHNPLGNGIGGPVGHFPMGASPAAGHLNLPGSPHVNLGPGGHTPSPAQGHMQVPMVAQHSQQGSQASGTSATTSPAMNNKKRRASVKTETEDGTEGGPQVNGMGGPKVKASPRTSKKARPGQ